MCIVKTLTHLCSTLLLLSSTQPRLRIPPHAKKTPTKLLFQQESQMLLISSETWVINYMYLLLTLFVLTFEKEISQDRPEVFIEFINVLKNNTIAKISLLVGYTHCWILWCSDNKTISSINKWFKLSEMIFYFFYNLTLQIGDIIRKHVHLCSIIFQLCLYTQLISVCQFRPPHSNVQFWLKNLKI